MFFVIFYPYSLISVETFHLRRGGERSRRSLHVFVVPRWVLRCHSERRSGGPEPRNLPLLSDLSTAARGDKKAFGLRPPLTMTKKRGMEKAANAFSIA